MSSVVLATAVKHQFRRHSTTGEGLARLFYWQKSLKVVSRQDCSAEAMIVFTNDDIRLVESKDAKGGYRYDLGSSRSTNRNIVQ